MHSSGYNVAVRVKALGSIQNKVVKPRLSGTPLGEIEDIFGIRIVTPSLKAACKASHIILSNATLFKVVTASEHNTRQTDLGHRGLKFVCISSTNKIFEVQVKSELQNSFAGFYHDKVYKNQNLSLSNGSKKYLRRVSTWLYEFERTGDASREKPIPTEQITQKALEFKLYP